MYEFHPYYTNDGSVGLFCPEFNDIYHSATGALTEAYEKFILPIDFEKLLSNDEIKVLDICYGIGYNSKSFLNFIFENYLQENFSKKSQCTAKSIDTIYTNNNYQKEANNISTNKVYNDKIHTYNIIPKISITAVDNDKILSFLSPFIKTGENNFDNKNIDFDYKKIEKYLDKNKRISNMKINKFINFLIFEKIAQNNPDFLQNQDISKILHNKKFSSFFDANLVGIFDFYHSKRYSDPPSRSIKAFLHNIYYRHVSNCYKKTLKSYSLQDINFNLKNDDARNVIKEDSNKYNLIFLDAFTPSKCPCLWSYEFFKELFEHLEQNGMILTYSTSASIRSAMLEAGFYIGEIYNKRENKFTGTIAVKDKSLIKYELSEYDLGLLKTTAGIFYRDENLTGLNEAINEARIFEVRNSNRISSSHYNKEYKNKGAIC